MKKIKKYLKKHLTKDRYHHTLGVASTAVAMAMRYNPDPSNSNFIKRAELAGLLHDCAKCMDNNKKTSDIARRITFPVAVLRKAIPIFCMAK